jgi:23S rRNA G2069 N7-methylase RlmK/C1962 C5-methylase RlmI
MEFRKGSQLVFEGAIAFTAAENQLQLAELVQVKVLQEKDDKKWGNRKGYQHYDLESAPSTSTQMLGWGVYNPFSLYRVRILCHENLEPALADKIKSLASPKDALEFILLCRLKAALNTRREGLGLPNKNTDTYRLVNGEGDGLSGLAVDILGGRVAVVMSSAAWCQVHRGVIVQALKQVLPPNFEIVWKTTPSRLQQDGWKDVERNEDDQESAPGSQEVVVRESGILYKTYPYVDGQKTGIYSDQRENKAYLAQFCAGKRILDLCCYHGGFSFNAKVLGSALHCTGVDSSQDAIGICHENAMLNGLTDSEVTFVRDDIADFMKQQIQQKASWDVVVLDPPKLAPSVTGLERASRKYQALNRDAIQLVNPKEGGLIMTCTCSAAMTQHNGGQYFLQTIQQAAATAGRQITLLRTSGAAPCHTTSPASFPAGNYLTAALFYVAPFV